VCNSLRLRQKSPTSLHSTVFFTPNLATSQIRLDFSHISGCTFLHGTSRGPRRSQDGDGLELVFTCGLGFFSPTFTTAWPTSTGHCRRVTPPPYTHCISLCVSTFVVIGLRSALAQHSGNFASTFLSLTPVSLETLYCFSKANFPCVICSRVLAHRIIQKKH
jgi:hypothetical protein